MNLKRINERDIFRNLYCLATEGIRLTEGKFNLFYYLAYIIARKRGLRKRERLWKKMLKKNGKLAILYKGKHKWLLGNGWRKALINAIFAEFEDAVENKNETCLILIEKMIFILAGE